MFIKLYKGELRKLFRLKTLIIILTIGILLFIIMNISIGFISDYANSDYFTEDVEEVLNNDSFALNLTLEELNQFISETEMLLEAAKERKADSNYAYLTSPDDIYYLESQLAALNYIKDNKLYDTDVYVYQGALSGFISPAAYDYVSLMLLMLSSVVLIYGFIVGSGAVATEAKEGTLKLLFMRPITRNKLLTAKLLAMLTGLIAVFVGFFILCLIYGYASFPSPARKILLVFNARWVFNVNASSAMCITFFTALVSALSVSILAFAAGTLTKSRVAGIGIPIGSSILASIIALTGIGSFWFDTVISFDRFFGVTYPTYGFNNFFLNLVLFIVYIGGLISASYIVFNKRDLA